MKKLKVEIRADNTVHIEGYVNAVGRDSRVLPSPMGRFVEQVEPRAFEKALSSGKTVQLKHNHERALGSTSDGSLSLHEDAIGLYAKAVTSDQIIRERAKNGELRGWSFGFSNPVEGREENTAAGVPRRILRSFDLAEVSIIDNTKTPCYVGTSIEVRGTENVEVETRAFEDAVETKDLSKTPGKPEFSHLDREIEFLKLKGECR